MHASTPSMHASTPSMHVSTPAIRDRPRYMTMHHPPVSGIDPLDPASTPPYRRRCMHRGGRSRIGVDPGTPMHASRGSIQDHPPMQHRPSMLIDPDALHRPRCSGIDLDACIDLDLHRPPAILGKVYWLALRSAGVRPTRRRLRQGSTFSDLGATYQRYWNDHQLTALLDGSRV
jgi:hypothetical protein